MLSGFDVLQLVNVDARAIVRMCRNVRSTLIIVLLVFWDGAVVSCRLLGLCRYIKNKVCSTEVTSVL